MLTLRYVRGYHSRMRENCLFESIWLVRIRTLSRLVVRYETFMVLKRVDGKITVLASFICY